MHREEITILVVDDHISSRVEMVDVLTKLYKKVYSANNGEEALELINKEQINVVVTDLNMPVMCGMNMMEELYGDNTVTTPTIVISAHDTLVACYAKVKHIKSFRKPVDMRDIIKAIDEVCKDMCEVEVAFSELRKASKKASEMLAEINKVK